MKVPLGAFARSGIEAELGPDVAGAVLAALAYYRGKLESGRPPIPPPRFLDGCEPGGSRAVLDLAVDAGTKAVLAREARAHGLDLDRLAAHAVLVYLAELDFLAAPGPGA